MIEELEIEIDIRYLNNINYAEYLKRNLLVGQVDPWRRNSQGKPIYGLLCSLEHAHEVCNEWGKQDVSKKRLVEYLKLNDILILEGATEFRNQIKKFKDDEQAREDKKPKRQISEEHREKLRNHAKKLNEKKYNNSQ